jgi:hypothetical protein
MKRRLSAALFLLSVAVSAQAYTDYGGRFTSGPEAYTGLNAFAEWGDDYYYLRPSFNTYKSDVADRYSTYFLGAGFYRGAWDAGAEVSMTPETGGYKNTAVFVNSGYNVFSDFGDEAIFEDITLGAFAGLTAHEDAYALSTASVSGGGGRGGSVSSLTDSFKLNQTDYGLSVSVKARGIRASGRFAKTAYDKDITAESRQLPVDIGGIGASGFPDTAFSARLRIPGLPLSPAAGYVKTSYLLDQPDSESFDLGLSFKAGPADISAGWENFNPGGGAAKSDYYSLGLTFSF